MAGLSGSGSTYQGFLLTGINLASGVHLLRMASGGSQRVEMKQISNRWVISKCGFGEKRTATEARVRLSFASRTANSKKFQTQA